MIRELKRLLNTDLISIILKVINSIEEGSVTTYKTIAKFIGDSRYPTKTIANLISTNIEFSRNGYRVVCENGHLGNYYFGIHMKKVLLECEGIEVCKYKIANLNKYYNEPKYYIPILKKFRKFQKIVSENIKILDKVNKIRKICGFDCSYVFIEELCKEIGIGCLVIYDLRNDEIEDVVIKKLEVRIPYIPTYLGFREILLFKECFDEIEKDVDVIFVDGNGMLHPIKSGIATMIGVVWDIPTIGVAKRLLCGRVLDSNYIINEKKEVVGYRYKGGYISVGNLLSINECVRICKKVWGKKQPKVLEIAHNIVSNERKCLIKKIKFSK